MKLTDKSMKSIADLEDLEDTDRIEPVEEDAIDHGQDFLAEARAIRQNIIANFFS